MKGLFIKSLIRIITYGKSGFVIVINLKRSLRDRVRGVGQKKGDKGGRKKRFKCDVLKVILNQRF